MFCFMYYFCFVGDFLNKYKVVKGKKMIFAYCTVYTLKKNKTMKGKNINIVCTLKYTNKENKWSFTSS